MLDGLVEVEVADGFKSLGLLDGRMKATTGEGLLTLGWRDENSRGGNAWLGRLALSIEMFVITGFNSL